MNERILAAAEESALENEFLAACENPSELDCGFTEQRCSTGFNNFDFDPNEAIQMREKELARIASEWEADDSNGDYDEPTVDEEGWSGLEDNEDDFDLPGLDDDDEDDYDRYDSSYDFDDDEDDDWDDEDESY